MQMAANRLTRAEVAHMIGVHEKTITRWVREGRFPPPIFNMSMNVRFWDRGQIVAVLDGKDWRTVEAESALASLTAQPSAPAIEAAATVAA